MREEMRELHRTVVMCRADAVYGTVDDITGWHGYCQHCANHRMLYVSHIEPKGRVRHMEFDTDNAFAFCYYCHIHWWHKHPREAQEFRERMLGRLSEELELRARTGGKPDWFAVLVSLRIAVNDIRHGG